MSIDEFMRHIHERVNADDLPSVIEKHPANLMKRYDIIYGMWPERGKWGGGNIRVGVKAIYGAERADEPPEIGKSWHIIRLDHEAAAFAMREWMAAGCTTMTIKIEGDVFGFDGVEQWKGGNEMADDRKRAHIENWRRSGPEHFKQFMELVHSEPPEKLQ